MTKYECIINKTRFEFDDTDMKPKDIPLAQLIAAELSFAIAELCGIYKAVGKDISVEVKKIGN